MNPGAPYLSRFLSLLAAWILLLMPPGVQALPGVHIGFQPAWEGRYLSGKATEVEVRILSGTGGPFQLILHSSAGEVFYQGTLEANKPYTAWLPLLPNPDEPVIATLFLDDKEIARRKIWFSPGSKPLTVLVQPVSRSPSPSTVSVPAQRLPRTIDGYRSVGSLTLSMDSLVQLDREQLEALRNYVGDCGNLWLAASSRVLSNQLKAIAGCGGTRIKILGQHHVAYTAPASASLPVPLASPTDHVLKPLMVLMFLYLLSLLLVASTRNKAGAMIAVPLLGTAGLLAFWLWQGNPAKLSIWAEMGSGSHSIRYRALLQIEGLGIENQRQVRLSRRLGIPDAKGNPPIITIEAHQPDMASLVVPVRPFSRPEYHFRGSFSAPFRLRLDLNADGPKVVNLGSLRTPAGFFTWKKHFFRVPALAPGQDWRPSPDTAVESAGPWAAKITERSGNSGTALVLPLSLPDTKLVPPDSGLDTVDGWLLIRPSADST